MYLHVSCYDMLDELHVRVRLVESQGDDMAMATSLALNSTAHWPADVKTDQDIVAWLGETLIDMAHSGNPLL